MRRFAAIILEWLLVALGSMLVMALVYPDMLVTARVRFTAGHDIQIPFQSAWMHAGYFLHGGVQLWNRLDQVNHAYFHLATGFHGLTAITEGWLFSLFADGLARPGEAFQAFHPLAFFTLATLFRSAGGLALISLYPVPLWARVLTLLLTNTLLAAPAYNGVMTGFLYSLGPLVLYFIVLFFRRIGPFALLWAVLALGLAFAQIPLLALGYFYLPIHYFVIACLVGFSWWTWRDRRSGAARPVVAAPGRRLAVPAALACAALALVLAMDVNYLRLLMTTFHIADSGLGGSQGRFGMIFDPMAYMIRRPPGPEVSEFLSHALDFTVNRWWFSWQLIGPASLGLALIGLSHGRHRERWLHAAAFALTLLAQFPRAIPSWGLPAHAIAAFTDPFAFLVAHTHMSMMLMSVFLIVPIALGMAALWRRATEPLPRTDGWVPDAIASGLLLAGALFSLLALPLAAAVVAAAVFLGVALCLLAPRIAALARGARLRALALGVPMAAIAADLAGFSVYLDDVPYTGDRIQPRVFEGMAAGDNREIQPVVIDYQNPAALSFPRHMRLAEDPRAPSTDPGFFAADYAFYFGRTTYIGAFFDTIFLSREFERPRLYELRQVRYAGAADPEQLPEPPSAEDRALNALLRSDDRALVFVPVGVDAGRVGLAQLVAADAGGWAVALAAPAGGGVPGALPALPEAPPAVPARTEAWRTFDIPLAETVARRERDGLVEYDFVLPEGFPGYLATNLFSADSDAIRLRLDGRELAPAQGRLIRPFTFDVRNVATDRLVVALPPDWRGASQLQLSVLLDGLLEDVNPKRHDTVGFTIGAPADGWLVWRAPYEEGWTASMDGAPAALYLANRTAMAVGVPSGRHEIVFAYKPSGSGSWTRRLVEANLIASPLLALLVLGVALIGAAAGHGWPPPARGGTPA